MNQMNTAIVTQPYRETYAKIELLNFQYQTVERLEGVVTTLTVSINADSDIRRTCNATIVVKDSSFKIDVGGKIWLDKYIRVFYGVKDVHTNEIVWTNMGVFLINNPNHVYSIGNDTISFQAVDLMAKLTGMRNGFPESAETVIPFGSDIRSVIISTLKLGGFTKYIVADNPQKTPYEIKIGRESSLYQILTQLRDISPEYEMFFDVNGNFVYQKIPTGDGEPILLDNTVLDKTVLSVNSNTSFTDVKNVIEVWGKMLTPSYYGKNVALTGDSYIINKTDNVVPVAGVMVGFEPQALTTNPKIGIKLQNGTVYKYPLVDSRGDAVTISEAKRWYAAVVQADKTALFLGNLQVHAIAKDENPDSPYYIKGSIGEIRKICSGGEYDNIQSHELAQQRANYELYLSARRHDAVGLTSLPIPWIDVNTIMSYRNEGAGVDGKFLIKNVSMGLDVTNTMSINACRYYPQVKPVVYDPHTKLLIHGGSLVDNSIYNVPLTNYGVEIRDDTAKFGNKSLYFNGKNSHFSFPQDSIIYSDKDFTFDWWEYPTQDGRCRFNSSQFSLDDSSHTNQRGMMLANVGTNFTFSTDGTHDSPFIAMYDMTLNMWTHWATVRSGNVVKTYKNGRLFKSTACNGVLYQKTSKPQGFGIQRTDKSAESLSFIGYMDEIRISDVARWTSDFTPPDKPYDNQLLKE